MKTNGVTNQMPLTQLYPFSAGQKTNSQDDKDPKNLQNPQPDQKPKPDNNDFLKILTGLGLAAAAVLAFALVRRPQAVINRSNQQNKTTPDKAPQEQTQTKPETAISSEEANSGPIFNNDFKQSKEEIVNVSVMPPQPQKANTFQIAKNALRQHYQEELNYQEQSFNYWTEIKRQWNAGEISEKQIRKDFGWSEQVNISEALQFRIEDAE